MSSFRRRLMMQQADNWLPAGCVELEYIEGTGTQWIGIGVEIRDTDIMFCAFKFIHNVLGCVYRVDPNMILTTWNNNMYITTGKSKMMSDFDSVYTINVSPGSTVVKAHNDIFMESNDSVVNASGIYLFNYGGSIRCAKIYSLSVNGKLDIVPVLDANGMPCMYDRVSRQFFYNQGTGEFLYKLK